MASRRMFSKDVVCSDRFLDMPASAQALYFQYGLEADDDGFVSAPKKILRLTNASDDDLKILVAKGFLIPFDSGVVVVKYTVCVLGYFCFAPWCCRTVGHLFSLCDEIFRYIWLYVRFLLVIYLFSPLLNNSYIPKNQRFSKVLLCSVGLFCRNIAGDILCIDQLNYIRYILLK